MIWNKYFSSNMVWKHHFEATQGQLGSNEEQSGPCFLRGGENGGGGGKGVGFIRDKFSSWFIELGQPTFLVLPTFPCGVPVFLFVGINYEVIWVNYLKCLCNCVIIVYWCPYLTFLA